MEYFSTFWQIIKANWIVVAVFLVLIAFIIGAVVYYKRSRDKKWKSSPMINGILYAGGRRKEVEVPLTQVQDYVRILPKFRKGKRTVILEPVTHNGNGHYDLDATALQTVYETTEEIAAPQPVLAGFDARAFQ